MAITRSDIETYVIDSHGSLMSVVGFDVATQDGTNRVIGTAIARTLRAMGLAVANPLSPSDDDLAGIPDGRIGELLDDRLPLAVLEMILDNWGAYNESNNTTRQDKGSLLRDLMGRIEAKRKLVESVHGTALTVSPPASGVRCDVAPCPCPAPALPRCGGGGMGDYSSRWV